MNLRRLHNKLISGRITIPASIFTAFLFRVFAGISYLDFSAWVIFLIQVGIAVSFMPVNHTYTILSKRTMLPTLFFLLLTSNPAFYYDLTGTLMCAAILVCFLSILNSYQNPHSQANAFNVFFLITLCSVFWSPVLFLIPMVWINMFRFQALSFKTFFASFIGIFAVELFVFSWSVYKEDIRIFVDLLPDFGNLFHFQYNHLSVYGWIYIGVLFLLLLMSGISSFLAKSSEKIRTSTFAYHLYLVTIYLLFLYLFTSEWNSRWLLFALIPSSFLTSYYFTVNANKLASYLLLFTIAFYILYSAYSIVIIP